MWHPFKHKTIFTQRGKCCRNCFKLLKWKYDSKYKPRKTATCCDCFYNIFYGTMVVTCTVKNYNGRLPRLLL